MINDLKRKSLDNLTLPSNDSPHLVNYSDDARKEVYEGIYKKMVDFMFERTDKFDNEIAIEYFGIKITYEEMKNEIIKYAKALNKFGIQKGDFISICLPNIPEVIYLKYAVNIVGGVSNMIDPRTNPDGIKERVNFSNSKLLFVVQDICKDKIENIKYKLQVEKIISISPSHALPKNILDQTIESLPANMLYSLKNHLQKAMEKEDKYGMYEQLDHFLKLSELQTGNYSTIYEENQPVTALYTSGTTADSMKAGLFSNENYNAMVKNMSYGSKYIVPNKRFLGAIPFFSAYGSFCGFHHSFANAWDVVMIPKFKPQDYAKLILKTKSNAALGVPKFWDQLANIKINKDMCQNIEIPVTGGDWISSKSIENINIALQKGGSKVLLKIGYGATEFGGVVSTTSDEKLKYNSESVGIALPANDVIIIDPLTGEELGYNQPGELCVSGPTMMLGYLNNDRATEAITIIKNGKKYYRTGDKMEINEFGDLIYHDRYKRVMMRPDGHTVACSPIEDTIISHPLVENCAVVGIKINEDANGTVPTAFVQLKNIKQNLNIIAKMIDDYCLERLGERERALVITFVDKIPYTMNGKIDFTTLSSNKFEDMDIYIMDNIFFEKNKKLSLKNRV
ncbi:MAG: acyl--CoA ligase [Clostridium sp.]|nr:acyl--CoA ligase [Clostridium sp.]MCM1444765.1 acyl--CoA ligase [Candidatus Amulumruptor caecigallinarius]